MKILTVVGARPQFVKAAAISRTLRERHQEILVHTGQHYDYEMSGVFFDRLNIPAPDINLNVGSGPHGAQTAAMLEGLEQLLLAHRPDGVLVYGDTNSTLAGALAASKLCVPIAHVEAGLRSFNRRMPEEINRLVTDHLASVLFCPSATAVKHLTSEGITGGVHLVGDVMLDVLRWAEPQARAAVGPLLKRLELEEQSYIVATIHRAENTDDRSRFHQILHGLNALDEPVVFPVHPRARALVAGAGVELKPHIRLVQPLGYLEMLAVTAAARLVLTDSGGLQKEAYWLGVPCVTLRDETEWVETVRAGWNVLAGADSDQIVRLARSFVPRSSRPDFYGDGTAARSCVDLLERAFAPASDAALMSSPLTESIDAQLIA